MTAPSPPRRLLPLVAPPPGPRPLGYLWSLAILLSLALTLIASCRTPLPPPSPPVVAQVESCLAQGPPVFPLAAARVERSNGLCPYDYSECRRLESAIALGWWISEAIAWQERVEDSCGPARAAGERYVFDSTAASDSATAVDAGAPTPAFRDGSP